MTGRTYAHNKLKSSNLSLVMRLICTGQANTRGALSKITGLSRMTVTNLVNELIDTKYLHIAGQTEGASLQGRKAGILEVSPHAPKVVGIFIERDACRLILSTIDAKIIRQDEMALWQGITGQELLDTLGVRYRKLVEGVPELLGIGIASIGPVDRENGVILSPPDFWGLENIPVKSYFEALDDPPVYFDNNMNAAVLAEQIFGKGRGIKNIAYVGVLRGVGAGIVSDGQLLRGPTGIVGEIGHTTINFLGPLCQCGNRGCLELYTSLPVIVQSANEEIARHEKTALYGALDWPKLVVLARRGDHFCMRALDDLCELLSIGLINLVNTFDCEHIFLGHDIALAEGLIEAHLEELVNRRILAVGFKRVQITMSAFGRQAPFIGSVCLALQQELFSYNQL